MASTSNSNSSEHCQHLSDRESHQPQQQQKVIQFSEWIHCICVVTFDLELGQALEAVYPPHVTLSEQEKLNICYLAFPDSNSGCMGDTQFHIRLRVAPAKKNTLLSPGLQRFNLQCVPAQRADSGHYHGFVYFRQIRDQTLPRGYFQKSVVLLSRLPFTNLFYEITSLIAPRYFAEGGILLDKACAEISDWPSLRTGECVHLPLLDTVYQAYIPSLTSANFQHSQQPQLNTSNIENISQYDEEVPTDISRTGTLPETESDNDNDGGEEALARKNAISANSDATFDGTYQTQSRDNNPGDLSKSSHQSHPIIASAPTILSSLHEIDIFRSLQSVLSYMHLLWELVLTGEPIVVMSTSPSDCSHMVQSLMSLIAPLPYCAESRPYFTIHDSEFREFTQRQQGPPPIILGVTNPFFAKTLQHWPHTIRLADNGNSTGNVGGALANQQNQENSQHISGKLPSSATLPNIAPSNQQKLRKLKIFTKILDSPPGVYTQYKPFLQKDKTVIKNILAGVKKQRPTEVQSALLRRHLLELTQSFMIPLERYMASLMPLQKDISAFKAAPVPNHFKPDCFLASLEQSGPQLTSPLKGDWCGLYKRFFRSPNFRDWYEHRYMELSQTLEHLQLQALSNADLKQWVEGKHEVEIVDMILKVKQKLKLCNEMPMDCLPQTIVQQNHNARRQLVRHLEDMKRLLPDDLKTILSNS